MNQYDVAVLGAGAAGLAVALSLVRTGRRVVLIEARERIGGRIATRPVVTQNGQSFPVELGAEFIHGLPEESWTLVGEAGLETSECSGRPLEFADGRLRETGGGWFHVLEQMTEWWARQPAGFDASFAQYLEGAGLPAAAADGSAAYVEGFNAADRRIISVAALARQQLAEDAIEGDRNFRLRAGYVALPAYLARRFAAAGGELRLSSTVTSVRWRPHEVTLAGTGADGAAFEIHASRAVITLPLGVLQSGSVHFDPLPAPVRVAASMVMGKARRITLQFARRFWLEDVKRAMNGRGGDFSFLFTREALVPTWWTPEPLPWPVITGWVGGPKVACLPEALAEYCVETLAAAFQRSAAEVGALLEAAHTHDWQSDPLALGAYSYVPAGAIHASAAMAQPVEATLFFAGEHTDTRGYWGTVHGALASGFAAATSVAGGCAGPIA